jgi:hypothetical protein
MAIRGNPANIPLSWPGKVADFLIKKSMGCRNKRLTPFLAINLLLAGK